MGELERIDRATFVERFVAAFEPGDHLTLMGGTHRGKSTLWAQVVPHLTQFDQIAFLCPKGEDPAYAKLGRSTRRWPPKKSRLDLAGELFGWPSVPTEADEKPAVWRYDTFPVRTPADWAVMRGVFKRVMDEATGRPNNPKKTLAIVIEDSRITTDRKLLRLEAESMAALIIGRAKRVSMVNFYQAPRWNVREGLDQISHGLVWNNEDRDTAMRLAEISGYDRGEFMEWMRSLTYHECLWFDVRAHSIVIVGAK